MAKPTAKLSPQQAKRLKEKEAAEQAKKQKQLIVLIGIFALVMVYQFVLNKPDSAPPPPPPAVVATGPDAIVSSDPATKPKQDINTKDPALLTAEEKRKLQQVPDRWPGISVVPNNLTNPYRTLEDPSVTP